MSRAETETAQTGAGDEFELVGTGQTVYEDDDAVEGPLVWLESPAAVIEFVGGEDVADSIVLARGGTTTFLTPALTAGVKGVVTLQGSPESHLGILSREYGIPCVMGVTFKQGVRTSRGERIPAEGTRVRVDISDTEGKVYVEPGAPTSDDADDGGADDEAATAQAEEVKRLLENFQGEVPHGSQGSSTIRARLATEVLDLKEESLQRELRDDEADDLLAYMAWNIWDLLAARATEGESGLIPRQEYECVGCVQSWQRYPELYAMLLDEVGVDGLMEIGSITRREVGSKVNLLHMWCSGFTPAFGRGILCDLGLLEPTEKRAEIKAILQHMRRLYAGAWGQDEGPIMTSDRGYRACLLDDEWITRFRDECIPIDDPERRKLLQRFSASTELMGFLLHFDNRSGLADSGPYPLEGGGFMIVRDHFLSDDLYHWADVAEDLPHAITQAMFFRPDRELSLALMDHSTLFTKPGNYLKHLTGMAVYARDRWDTPVSEIRALDEDEMARIQSRCDQDSSRLYRRIASMPRREKIMAGAQVYYTDFIAPFARAAGVWDKMVAEHDFFELDPVASETYYTLVKDGVGMEVLPRLFLMGTGYPPVTGGGADDGDEADPAADAPSAGGDPDAADPEQLPALHVLALRGTASELPGDADALESEGLVVSTRAGYMLSEEGHAAHDRLLEKERESLDLDRLASAYDRFLAANGPLKSLSSRWQSAEEEAREDLIDEMAEIVERIEPAMRRTIEVVARFEPYRDRLKQAMDKLEDGEHDYAVSPRVDSVHTVWMELHEDYLQTLGRSREEEGSY